MWARVRGVSVMVHVHNPIERRAESVEIIGRIKWFDVSKGYGFIIPEGGGPDVLLHVTHLQAAGYQFAHEGATVVCEVTRNPRGFRVFKISDINESTTVDHRTLPQTHVHVEAESDWERATVKWFNHARGFGFLTCEGVKEEIFVHMKTLRRFGFTEPQRGQIVEIRWREGSKGLMAAELRPVR